MTDPRLDDLNNIPTPEPDATVLYDEDAITTLDWKEHIRRRPGMYIGNVDDGSKFDDGIYVLVKEVMDNAIDEFVMGYGKLITIDVTDEAVQIRDLGRGIPLGKLVEASSRMNTGGKYDSYLQIPVVPPKFVDGDIEYGRKD